MPSLRQIRLATGLVLFTYVTLHFANHALGNISVGAMESGVAIQKLIWRSPLGATILYLSLLTHMGLGFWALYARRHFRWTRTRGEPARSRPRDSVPPGRSRDRLPRVIQSIRDRQGLCRGTAQVLGPLAGQRRPAGDPLVDRLDSRLSRPPFLAAAEAVLSAGQGASVVDRRAFAGARPARLLSGRQADAGGRRGPCLAGATYHPGPDRNRGPERGSARRAHADPCLPCHGAGLDVLRQGRPSLARAPRRARSD